MGKKSLLFILLLVHPLFSYGQGGTKYPSVPLKPLIKQARPGLQCIAVYHVNSGHRGKQTGAPKTPFLSVAAALEAARVKNACSANITVHPGRYRNHLEITRPTTIIGVRSARKGSMIFSSRIRNQGGHALKIENLTILSAQDFGIFQRGGSLVLNNVSVLRTQRNNSDSRSGTAVELVGGVKGDFHNLTLDNNTGTALYVSGRGTVVKVNLLKVRNNDIHPKVIEQLSTGFVPRAGAVDVSDRAKLLVNLYDVHNNRISSFIIRDRGQAFLKNGLVNNTQKHQTSRWSSLGGFNLVAVNGGVLQLENYESKNAGCGLRASKGYVNADNGRVHHNSIGICIGETPDPTYDIARCIMGSGHRIRLYNNETRAAHDFGAPLPVPSPGGPGGPGCILNPDKPECQQPPPPPCPTVQWE